MGKDLTDLIEKAVLYGRAGRMLAQLGGYFTSAEQELIQEIYSRLLNKENIIDDSPAIGYISSKTGRKSKISISEAVNWFEKNYKKWSIPLQNKRKEIKPPKVKIMLTYGLREGRDFDDEEYISAIVDIANLPRNQAEKLYREILKPQLISADESSGMIEIEIKKKS
ncbi:MAG: hypothetical protein ABH811_01485 [archaeon]